MITPMRKISVICRQDDRATLLERLRDFGAVHLTLPDRENHDIVFLRQRLQDTRKVIQKLSQIDCPLQPLESPPAEVVDRLLQLEDERKTLEQLQARLHREARIWEPFGAVSPDTLRALQQGGLEVAFYRSPQSPVDLPADTAWLTAAPGFGVAVSTASLRDVATPALQLPVRGPARIRQGLQRLERIQKQHTELQQRAAANLDALQTYAEDLDEDLQFLLAQEGMDSTEELSWIEGFVPVGQDEALRRLVAECGAGVAEREPTGEDPTPTLLQQGSFVSWIQPVLSFLGVTPGYREVDVGWSFLIFLAVFSGMIIGDAGYGLLLMAIVGGLMLFKPATRGKFSNLLLLMGGATAVWGFLTGNLFGLSGIPAVFPQLSAQADPKATMNVCFLLGASHLTLAHGWNLWRNRRSLQALAELGWIGSTWTMYGITGQMVLGWESIPAFLMPVFLTSVTLIVVFMTPPAKFKEQWVDHMMLPLTFVNNFVDVVSYVRLYAVGMATFALASSFNTMIFPQGAERSWIVTGIMAVILILGHALNFILAGMGVMVHGIRLNTLEFASHLGLTWSGIPYTPFRRVRTSVDSSPSSSST